MSTNILSAKDIKRDWKLVDAKDQILGRMATQIASMLIGKSKPSRVPYLDSGDYVVVVNAALVKTTGKKEEQKEYFRHSGYPGGDRKETLAKMRQKMPEYIIKHAVWGMMPKTKLGRQMIKKLYVVAGAENPYQEKFAKK